MTKVINLTPGQLMFFRYAVTDEDAPAMCFEHGNLEVWVKDQAVVRSRKSQNDSILNDALLDRGTLEPTDSFRFDKDEYTLERDELEWLKAFRVELIELKKQVTKRHEKTVSSIKGSAEFQCRLPGHALFHYAAIGSCRLETGEYVYTTWIRDLSHDEQEVFQNSTNRQRCVWIPSAIGYPVSSAEIILPDRLAETLIEFSMKHEHKQKITDWE